jgi:anti-anti-sigma factor
MAEQQVLDLERNDAAVVARVRCTSFDHRNTDQFRDELRAACEDTSREPFVLEMSRVEFMASLTIGVLVEHANRLKMDGRHLVVVGLTPNVDRAIRIAGLHDLFEVRACLEDVTDG